MMKEISITNFDLSTMCRLCLSNGAKVLDLFSFSPSFKDLIANVIMKCAPIKIRSCDEMPNFICQQCYTRLEKTHQFQMQIIQSEKTLQRYLEQLHGCDKRPSEDPLIDNNMKGESSNLHDVLSDLNVNRRVKECENFNSASKINLELPSKSKIRNRQKSNNSSIPEECAGDTVKTLSAKDGECSDVNIEDSKLGGLANFNSACKTNEEMATKIEIKDEQIDDNPFIFAECANNTIETLSEDGGFEISCKDSKIDIGDIKFDKEIDVKWRENELANLNSASNSIEQVFLKHEIKDEPADSSLILTDCINDTVNEFFEGDNEITCEDTTIGMDHTLVNFVCLRSSDVESFVKSEEGNRNTSTNQEKHKKVYRIKINDKCSSRLSESKKCYSNSDLSKKRKVERTCERPYQCDVCKKFFTQLGNFNTHKKIHTDEKPYKCDVCKKCFTKSGNLRVHQLIHTGDKPYQCDVCNKRLTTSSSLKVHKRIHTGEKPYKCDFCEKCFTASGNFRAHKLIHTGEQPYQCDVCNKRCSTSSILEIHKRIHTGEKPYKCDVCTKCFMSSADLKRHKRIHTGEKPYKCDVCKKCFITACNLKSHKLIHTGEK